jgi:hypothetical protein
MDSLAAYCERVRDRLKSFDYAGKRLALEALGIEVVIDRDAEPQWRVYSEFDRDGNSQPSFEKILHSNHQEIGQTLVGDVDLDFDQATFQAEDGGR